MAKEKKTGTSFVLRDPNAKTPQPITFLFRFDNDRIKISTGLKIAPKFWDAAKCRVRNMVEAANKEEINGFLSDLEREAKRLFVQLQTARTLTKETLKAEIDNYLHPAPVEAAPVEPSLFIFIREFIEKSPERINPHTGKKVEYRTIQKYKTVYSVLQDFAKDYPRKLDFDTIDLDFYQDFTEYLTNKKRFAVNNVGKYIQTLKTFLNEATAKGLNAKQDYKSRRFKVVHEDSDSIYLNEAELQTLYDLDLSKSPRLDKVRDLFLVGCWTGLRFSDLIALRPEKIKDGIIRLEQIKTLDKVVIPCHPIVNAILAKYSGNLPRAISNQKMNDYLKEVCKLAGLTETTTKGITKAGVRLLQNFEKWELVSVHTARRSFATNMYQLGVPTVTIMRITGHRTEKAFLTYIKLSEDEHAQIIQTYWNQRPNPLMKGVPLSGKTITNAIKWVNENKKK